MRILHVIKGLGLAGAEKHLITLLAGLRAEGIDARLLLWVSPTQQSDDVFAAAQQNGIPIERWTIPRHFAPRFFLRLLRYLRQEKPDIVHTHLVHAETYAIPAAKLAGIPFVINSSHNDDPFRRRFVFRLRGWFLWKLTDYGIAISESVKTFLIDIEHARPDQIEVIYYGLEPAPLSDAQSNLRAELGLAPQARLIGSVCRLVPQKGIAYAIEAMGALAPRYPNLHYVIVGDGGLKNSLVAQVKSLNLEDRVHFVGWRLDVAALISQFELFLAPSLWEGFGLVFLEAMAAATPVISTRISCIPEVVADRETGLLVPPQDVKALMEAVTNLLDNPQTARRMGEAGRVRLVERFSQRHMIDQTIALYRRLKP